MNNSNPPKSPTCWYRFRLRTLLAILAAIAVVCSLFLPDVGRRIRRERNRKEVAGATAPIEELGGYAGFTDSEWYSDIEGKEAIIWVSFDKSMNPIVKGQTIDGGRLTNADMKQLREHLEGLPGLRHLELRGTQVTDEGLVHLRGLRNLETIKLEGRFSDAGLEHLRRLPNLSNVTLEGRQVTDATLEHLKGMTDLKRLGLGYTNVSDEGVKALRQALPNCAIIRYDYD